jgi:hypothetical protein
MSTPIGQLAVTDAEGLVSLVPHLLGFHPRDSLVVLIMEGTTLAATLRVDLPAKDPGTAGTRPFARHLAGYISAARKANAVFLLVYTEAPWPGTGDGEPPLARFVGELSAALGGYGYDVPDVLLIGGGSWRSLFCGDAACCPPAGHALADVLLSETNLRMVLEGSSPREAVWDGTTGERWPAAAAVRETVQSLASESASVWNTARAFERWCLALEQEPGALLAALRENPADTGALLAGLRDSAIRDALPYAAGVSARAARDALAGRMTRSQRGGPPVELGAFMLGVMRGAPDWDRIQRLWTLCRGLLPAAEGDCRAALLCILAWIEWAKGHSSAAHALVQTCRGESPEYRLARLLDEFLQHGRLPHWASRRETAWTGTP